MSFFALNPAKDADPNDPIARHFSKQNKLFVIGAAAFAVVALVLTTFVMDSREASRDSRDASETAGDGIDVQLANIARNACITDRRNDQEVAESIRDEANDIINVLLNPTRVPLGTYLELQAEFGESFNLETQYARATKAIHDRKVATERMEAHVLNQPPPVGCGAPITDIRQLKGDSND